MCLCACRSYVPGSVTLENVGISSLAGLTCLSRTGGLTVQECSEILNLQGTALTQIGILFVRDNLVRKLNVDIELSACSVRVTNDTQSIPSRICLENSRWHFQQDVEKIQERHCKHSEATYTEQK